MDKQIKNPKVFSVSWALKYNICRMITFTIKMASSSIKDNHSFKIIHSFKYDFQIYFLNI